MSKIKTKNKNFKQLSKYWNITRKYLQIIGNKMSSMIMPIIGIIMAWGIITAFFIPTGWTPVTSITTFIVGPVITYLIPSLIGFMGGLKYGLRGGLMGAFGAFCIIAGAQAYEQNVIWSNINILTSRGLGPQFLGAMIAGPLSSFILIKTEGFWDGKIKPGFEMLVNNLYFAFCAIATGLGIFFLLPLPIIIINYVLGSIIDSLTSWNAMPITSLLVEPAKPLFLNNAINHGVFTPLGIQQVQEVGKSLLFYIESNPGPGMGMLMAILLFDKNMKNKTQAGSASIVHFFGGIHEVYFPFILARPLLILGTMTGGVVGVALFQIFGAGAVAAASPGSIIALFAVSAPGGMAYAGLTLGIFGSLATSFLVSSLIIKLVYKGKSINKIENALEQMTILKGAQKNVLSTTTSKIINVKNINAIVQNTKKIVFACDAGMGSSAMGANLLKQMMAKINKDIIITSSSLTTIPKNTDIIITQKSLVDRAIKQNKNKHIYIIKEFLNKDEYIALINAIKNRK